MSKGRARTKPSQTRVSHSESRTRLASLDDTNTSPPAKKTPDTLIRDTASNAVRARNTQQAKKRFYGLLCLSLVLLVASLIVLPRAESYRQDREQLCVGRVMGCELPPPSDKESALLAVGVMSLIGFVASSLVCVWALVVMSGARMVELSPLNKDRK